LAPRRISPSETNATPREGAGLIAELIETQGQMLACQDQMVALWTEYQKLRLALFRDLGNFPFHDWASFYEHCMARGQAPRPRSSSANLPGRGGAPMPICRLTRATACSAISVGAAAKRPRAPQSSLPASRQP